MIKTGRLAMPFCDLSQLLLVRMSFELTSKTVKRRVERAVCFVQSGEGVEGVWPRGASAGAIRDASVSSSVKCHPS